MRSPTIWTHLAWISATLALAGCSAPPPPPPPPPPKVLEWRPWTAQAFAEAKRLNRPIYAYVGTTWCHWCHVMKKTTLADPDVIRLLRDKFICIRADAEERPELGERYIRVGWPANVILTPDAQPVREHAGYWRPKAFLKTLEQVVAAQADGTLKALPPEEPGQATGPLDATLELVRSRLDDAYNTKVGGWGTGNIMYPRWAPVEHAFLRSWHEPLAAEWERRAIASLTEYCKLIDPVWGGVYQYSDDGTWDSPHYEKLVIVQAGVIEVLAQAHLRTQDPRWLKAAGQVVGFLDRWLATKDRTAFYASQDAEPPPRAVAAGVEGDRYFRLDDQARRRFGAPRVDQRIYSEHNARIVAALGRVHAALQSEAPTQSLKRAKATMEQLLDTLQDESDGRWTVRHEVPPPPPVKAKPLDEPLDEGGDEGGDEDRDEDEDEDDDDKPAKPVKPAKPDEPDEPDDEAARPPALLHLRDHVEVGRALLVLFQVTGRQRWIRGARMLARGLVHTFRDPKGDGFFAHTKDPTAVGVFAKRRKPYYDNSRAARFFLHLDALDGTSTWRKHAVSALKSQANAGALQGRASTLGSYVLALEEVARAPTVITVAVATTDPALPRFLRAALGVAAGTALVRRVDPGGTYPAKRPTIYLCDASRCSPPITDLTLLSKELAAFMTKRAR